MIEEKQPKDEGYGEEAKGVMVWDMEELRCVGDEGVGWKGSENLQKYGSSISAMGRPKMAEKEKIRMWLNYKVAGKKII